MLLTRAPKYRIACIAVAPDLNSSRSSYIRLKTFQLCTTSRAIDSNNARRGTVLGGAERTGAGEGLINTEIKSGSRIGNYCAESRVRLIPGKPRLFLSKNGRDRGERARRKERQGGDRRYRENEGQSGRGREGSSVVLSRRVSTVRDTTGL